MPAQIIKIEIKKRDRDYGILTWHKSMDVNMHQLLEGKEKINLEVNNNRGKKKVVSYKYRRISVGRKKIGVDKKYFILEKQNNKYVLRFE